MIGFVCACAPGRAYQTDKQKEREKQQREEEQREQDRKEGNMAPPAAQGLQVTLRARRSKFSPGAPAVIGVALKNTTGSPFTIKNEFMSAIQRNTSFVRVFIDQKESAGAEMFKKRMLARSTAELVNFAPGEEKEVVEYEFYNLPTGSHSVYVSYSSQVYNYERRQQRWWLGTATSNMISIRVSQPDIQKKVTATGNLVIKNILADLKGLAATHRELGGIGAAAKSGGGAFPGIAQIVFGSGGLDLTVQVRGIDEAISPYPEFDIKYPYIGVTVNCYFRGGNNPVLRNAVFKVVRDRSQAFNKVTKDISDKKSMDIVAVNSNTLNLIGTSDLIVQGTIVSAAPEIQENQEQLWVVKVSPRKTFKGEVKGEGNIVFYTDSPTVRFKGAFVNKQFIIFLDLKYRQPVTYNLLGAEAVSPDLLSMIEQKLGAPKTKR